MNTPEQNFRLVKEIEANRRFLLTAYEQNPNLLANAEPRIRQLFQMTNPVVREVRDIAGAAKQRGISLVELIMFIVIISTAVAGVLLVMNQVTAHSADPLIRKQVLAIAESMLEEIKLQDLSGVGCAGTLAADGARTGVSSVCDYDGYKTTAGILDFSTNGHVGLDNYNIDSVVVAQIATLGGTAITPGSGVVITVTVAGPARETIEVTGYRAGK